MKSFTGPRLKKFITFGVGLGRDKKGEYISLVLVHENPDIAKDNVSLLKQQIEKVTWDGHVINELIYDTEIRTEGKVLLAKLYNNNNIHKSSWFLHYGTYMLHE